MNRIDKKFKELNKKKHKKNEKALVGFLTAGDPNFALSCEIIKKMCQNGLDVLELGIPFSDPTADGQVIQRSSQRALKAGITLSKVFKIVENVRKFTEIPIILFGYYNPIFKYGIKKFYEDAIQNGADGVLIVDLPLEESKEFTSFKQSKKIPLIRLVAPTTPISRKEKIAKKSSGFLYMISQTGITGSVKLDIKKIEKNVTELKKYTKLPICVGFGISTKNDVEMVSKIADGVVIGSAFERLIEENIKDTNLPQMVGKRTREYKTGTIIETL